MGGGKNQNNAPAKAQYQMAGDIWNQVKGPRQDLIDMYSGILKGNQPAALSPIWNDARSAIENQYTISGNNLRGIMPRGGTLYSALADNERNRALATSGLVSQATQSGIQGLQGLIGAGTGAATGGFASAAQNQQMQNASQNALLGSKGQALGLGVGMAAGGGAFSGLGGKGAGGLAAPGGLANSVPTFAGPGGSIIPGI